MPKDNINNIKENLKDAGFNESEITEFLILYKNSNLKEQCDCLLKKRKKLLERVHKEEKYMSCLDYLKYKIEK